ncbi:MAG: M1 family metallopeptidase [Lutibacter sp.]|uniref:M1 family metallopeptidase n=1 Tax=Lutibacter sp. TaxID=1925666 RepID=UPI0017ACBE21|nr:M1 family metallopeptidase [Lutibacter sp.]MBT8316973.1 M1 family metallopeptidase [Lutibacter sp.]NNJ57833.1 M1 family metallopeptidase [Lutibacter sp.]
MHKVVFKILALLLVTTLTYAQETEQKGHYNISKFKQLKEELPTPNSQHTASGAPGYEYTQQKVDYKIDLILDDENQRIYGEETITYHNNSKDNLEYLWLQLDQNMRAADSERPDIQGDGANVLYSPSQFSKTFIEDHFDGGFKIEYVKNMDDSDASYLINKTMMRLNLEKPLASGESHSFKIKWWYNINNHVTQGGRSGFEHFPVDGNNSYVIAQFFPRLCVYDNVDGWQNLQFWGRSEFALEFGDYEVSITTPADHVLGATGVLQNEKEVLTKAQQKRLAEARTNFDNPVIIVTQDEAIKAEQEKSKKTKTWKFFAENVRDYAFATSRKFIWDAMAVDINGRTVMAYSYYSKEANPLYGDHSTRAVAQTLITYSRATFDYPYHKAISVDGQMGMEYPQICFNPGRPNPDGTYSDRTKYRMIGVTIHEVGHNFFPMIINSDERQWTWMDEGLNSFVQMLAMMDYEEGYPLNRGLPKNIVPYMKGDQSKLTPIMTQGDHIYNFGSNAYAKPATGLWMLRNTIMGPELFDFAFKTYAKRWKFKHPTPADFFRSMEDASAMDLDWFWRGWFYTTGTNDIGIKEVKKYYVTDKPTERAENMAKRYGITVDELPPSLYLVSEDSEEFSDELQNKKAEDYSLLSDYIDSNFSSEEKNELKAPKYFYELKFEKPGDLVMPIIVEFEYEDGTKERKQYPAQIWRLNDKEVTKVFPSSKVIKNITVDPDEETADVDLSNNSWPKNKETKFDKFKREQIKG